MGEGEQSRVNGRDNPMPTYEIRFRRRNLDMHILISHEKVSIIPTSKVR